MFIRRLIVLLIGLLFFPILVQADSSIETRIVISPSRQAPTPIIFEEEYVEVGIPENLAQTGDQIPVAFTLVYRNPTNKKQELVETVHFPRGSDLAQILINGQEVQLLPEERTQDQYTLRLTLIPGIQATVILIFNTRAMVTANFNLVFQVGTSASDQLPAGKTHFIVHYPVEMRPGWATSSAMNVTLSGTDASATVQLVRPGESVFPLQILLPHDAERIRKAEDMVREQPKNLDALKNLSDVYRSLRAGNKQIRPAFAEQKYLEVEHQYILAKYGLLTQPKTLQEALELAALYSNGWSSPCPVVGECLNDWEEDLYRDLMTYVDQHVWDTSIPVEQRALQEIKQKDSEWKQKRGTREVKREISTNTQPEIKSDAVTTGVDRRLIVGGGIFLILVLGVGLAKSKKRI